MHTPGAAQGVEILRSQPKGKGICMTTDYIASITSPSVNPELAAEAAMSAMREAIIAVVIANTATKRRLTPDETVEALLPMADEFCHSCDIIALNRTGEGVDRKDSVKEFHFSGGNSTAVDIATMTRLLSEINNEAYAEVKLGYTYKGENYLGFCYHNNEGNFCAILHKCNC